MNDIFFIVHPRLLGNATWRRLRKLLEKQKIQHTICVSEYPGHAAALAYTASLNAELVVAVGGDGTVHEVANGLVEASLHKKSRACLGLFPLGTGNDFARALGLSKSADAMAKALVERRFEAIDIGVARVTDNRNEMRTEYFLCSGTIGFSAEVTRRTHKIPRVLPGTGIYLSSLLASLVQWKNVSVTLNVDGETASYADCFNVTFANTKFYGGGMIASPRASLQDGILEVVVMELSKPAVLRALPQTYKGAFDKVAGVRQQRGKRVLVETKSPLLVQADGEIIGTTPAEFSVLPVFLRVLIS